MEIDKLRERATQEIKEKHGQLSPSVVRELAANAGIHETTFGRILLPTHYRKPTRQPRWATLTALARSLDVATNWLANGVGSRQVDIWPRLVRIEAESEPPRSARDELTVALDAIEELPEHLQRRAYRAAVSGAIDAISSQGVTVPVEGYRALVRLDQMHINPGGAA